MSNVKKRGTAGASTGLVDGAGGDADEIKKTGDTGTDVAGVDLPDGAGANQGGGLSSGDGASSESDGVTGAGASDSGSTGSESPGAAGNGAEDGSTSAGVLVVDGAIIVLNASEQQGSLIAWAEGLSYPYDAILRNDGHFSVAEPETASMLCSGTAVPVVLHDAAHTVRVLLNLFHLNETTFHGEHKLRMDGFPVELIEAKG